MLLVFSRPLLNTDINDPLNLTIETAQQLSPMDPSNFKTIYSNTRRTARFIIIHAENDSPAFHEQSRHFYELLKQTGCNTVLIEIENTDHFGKYTLADPNIADIKSGRCENYPIPCQRSAIFDQ